MVYSRAGSLGLFFIFDCRHGVPEFFHFVLQYSRISHPKCKGLVVAYESRTARAKFLSQTRIEWYTYSKKIMKVYFPLPITGSFIDKIVCYSMWEFIYGSALTIRYRNVPKTSEEQKLNFLNWNLEIWVFFSRVMVNIVVIDRTNNTL